MESIDYEKLIEGNRNIQHMKEMITELTSLLLKLLSQNVDQEEILSKPNVESNSGICLWKINSEKNSVLPGLPGRVGTTTTISCFLFLDNTYCKSFTTFPGGEPIDEEVFEVYRGLQRLTDLFFQTFPTLKDASEYLVEAWDDV